MTESEIDAVFASLTEGHKAFWGDLPAQFLGAPLRIKLSYEQDSVEELKPLARTVLAMMDQVVPVAEREFRAYHEEFDPEAIAGATNPRIWIDEDAILDDGPTRWALVVECRDREDFGTHIEFDGAGFLEVWSGD